ncbi:MAG TPA: hypothetical protein VKT77_04410 [Chthonomonadaceae bacterium]|nr:hypothetical protein [Chthonomonadaceae bacterium]
MDKLESRLTRREAAGALALGAAALASEGKQAGAASSAGLPPCAPEEAGADAGGILAFVDAAARKFSDPAGRPAGQQTPPGLHSLVLVRHGKIVAEGWWRPYAARRKHMLYSLSKSFTSTAVGLAARGG